MMTKSYYVCRESVNINGHIAVSFLIFNESEKKVACERSSTAYNNEVRLYSTFILYSRCVFSIYLSSQLAVCDSYAHLFVTKQRINSYTHVKDAVETMKFVWLADNTCHSTSCLC